MNELIKRLTKELGVDKKQAEGGLIALLRAGRQNMAPRDFDQFMADIPGADQLLRKAPPPSTLSSLAGGLGSLLGGRNSPGRWAGLAASFTELGVDLATAKKFGPIVIDYVRHHGGEDIVDKMKAALKI
ncbi:MAG: DUF2780 domain-containing protein [Steroidobacteraceae bacterium]|jgi:hypothetical protein|nr:DUF2780 domain-containing protein [Steroidobacteraceae bacterium]